MSRAFVPARTFPEDRFHARGYTASVGSVPTALDPRFVRESLVGTGAFGEVFRGVDRATGSPIAIKRLHVHKTNPILEDRFAREALHLSRIDSVNVVRCLAYGTDEESRTCLVLEWVDGDDLSRRQLARPLTPAQAVDVVRQAALGLQALHDFGVVHRDVKPSNFIVTPHPDGSLGVKLIDLGIARAIGDLALTIEGQRVGTPAYMSPEQARGDPDIGPATDVYSLGVVLFELLAGERPFRADDPFAMLVRIVLEPVPRLRDIAPHLPPGLDEITHRALAKISARRFASAREMSHALARVEVPVFAPTAHGSSASTTIVQRAGVTSMMEQRVVTALFADVARNTDPDDGVRAFEAVAASHGGEVHRLLGRKLVAVFGGSRTRGDEVLRAGRAALAAARRPDTRLAVATCRAVTGGAELLGDAIERGARDLERSVGVIRVDAATAALAEPWFRLAEVADGFVLEAERLSVDAPRTLMGVTTPIVGRDREIAMLDAILLGCISEPAASAVLVTAPAGAGKSRLRYEFLQRAAARDSNVDVLLARGDPLRAGSAFGLLAQAIRRAAGIQEGESPAKRYERLVARIRRHVDPSRVPWVGEFLGEIAGVPTTDAPSEALRVARADPQRMGDSMLSAWEDWLRAECDAHPVLLVLEDLHWGDLPTVTYVASAMRTLAERPFMVLALARPDVSTRFPDLWAEQGVQQIRLGALSKRASERLVFSVLGEDLPEETVSRVVERAEGNAFFLEELIRAVSEGRDGTLPDTVLGMLQMRLDALGAETRFVLRAASVFGQAFWPRGVIALLSDSTDVGTGWATLVDRCLADLEAREIVGRRVGSHFSEQAEYAFRHALVREAAYQSLPETDRTVAHRLAAEWLERAGETDPLVLAEHYRRAQDARAAMHYLRAAIESLEGNDLEAAAERAQLGLALAGDGETSGRLELVHAEVSRWRGDPSAAAEHAIRAVAALPSGSGPWYRAVSEVVASRGRTGHTDEVLEWVTRLRAIPASPDSISERLVSLARATAYLLYGGDATLADVLIGEVEDIARGAFGIHRFAEAQFRRLRALKALMSGTPWTTVREFEAAVGAFESCGDTRNATLERVNLANAYVAVGANDKAERAARDSLITAEGLGLPRVMAYAALALANTLTQTGRIDEARLASLRARNVSDTRSDPRLAGSAHVCESRIAYAERRFEASLEHAREATRLLQHQPSLLAASLATASRALRELHRTTEALAFATQAMDLIESQSRVEFGEMLARLAHVEALLAVGEDATARARIAQACAILAQREADIDSPVVREGFRTNVPEHAALTLLAQHAPH